MLHLALFAEAQSTANPKQKEWLKKQIKILKRISPGERNNFAQFETIIYEDTSVMMLNVMDSAFVLMSNKGWVYIIQHSKHDNSIIGDISIAIDNKKRIYINEGHICGGMAVYQAFLFTELPTTDDFFRYFVNPTDNSGKWIRYK